MIRVAEFARFAAEMGHPMKVDTPKQIAQAFNSLMRAARKDDRLKLLEPLAIRTMSKAIYSTQNIGHYGLGFTHYSHFTSPIRRYSDVLAHRILERNLRAGEIIEQVIWVARELAKTRSGPTAAGERCGTIGTG